METILNVIPAWLALCLMIVGFVALAAGITRLTGSVASIKPLVLDLIDQAEHEIQGTKRGAERKAWVAAKLRAALDASKFGRMISWAITDETIGKIIQLVFDKARAAVSKQ